MKAAGKPGPCVKTGQVYFGLASEKKRQNLVKKTIQPIFQIFSGKHPQYTTFLFLKQFVVTEQSK